MPGPVSVLADVQEAIKEALEGNVTLNSTAVPVKANLGKNTAAPYILIGDGTEVADNCADEYGSQVTVTIQLVTQGRGVAGKEGYYRYTDVNSGISQIRQLLDGRNIKPDGAAGTRWACLLEMNQKIPEPDGETLRGVCRYRVWVDGL